MRVAGLSYSFMANLLDDCMTERWYTYSLCGPNLHVTSAVARLPGTSQKCQVEIQDLRKSASAIGNRDPNLTFAVLPDVRLGCAPTGRTGQGAEFSRLSEWR
jgi:hypothetical protein